MSLEPAYWAVEAGLLVGIAAMLGPGPGSALLGLSSCAGEACRMLAGTSAGLWLLAAGVKLAKMGLLYGRPLIK